MPVFNDATVRLIYLSHAKNMDKTMYTLKIYGFTLQQVIEIIG